MTHGGCFMCGHYHGTSKGADIPEELFLEQFQREILKYDISKIPMICIYNAGSLLNPEEIPSNILCEILESVCTYSNIKRIIIESRPEFIHMDILHKISKICENKIVEIGIGLETSNNLIRDTCINKGFVFSEYLEAVEKIRKFKNILTLTYISVKPILLTIEESITDVVQTISDILPYTDIISLEPISIQRNTVVEKLYKSGYYSPPQGWIIKDIMHILQEKDILDNLDLRIGGFEYYPSPDLVIENCPTCNTKLYQAIDLFNSSRNTYLLENLNCSCYSQYAKEKELTQQIALEKRITQMI